MGEKSIMLMMRKLTCAVFCMRKHTSCCRDDKRLPPEYARRADVTVVLEVRQRIVNINAKEKQKIVWVQTSFQQFLLITQFLPSLWFSFSPGLHWWHAAGPWCLKTDQHSHSYVRLSQTSTERLASTSNKPTNVKWSREMSHMSAMFNFEFAI